MTQPSHHQADGGPAFVERPVKVQQGIVHARDYAGAGPAFVLMHGFPDNMHIYDDLVPYLGSRRAAGGDIRLLGLWRSDKPAGAATVSGSNCGDLEAVVDQLGLGKIVPVAHDSSGLASMNFALAHPDRTATLVMLNAAYAASPSAGGPR